MINSRCLSTEFSVRMLFAPLALILLFVSPHAVGAQDNANNANVNRNTNAGTNINANNTNVNNTNVNRNGNGNQSPTPSPTTSPSPSPTPDLSVEGRRGTLIDGTWYFVIITGMFIVVLLPFASSITSGIRSSGGANGPLGLPDGSVRAILAYTLVTFLGFYILASVLSFSDFKPPESLLGIVATVIGFYFGSRTNEGRDGEARTGSVEVSVTDKSNNPLPNAVVELTQEDGLKLSKTTDTGGKGNFENVSTGAHKVVAAPAGGGAPSAPQDVTVTAGGKAQLKIQL